MGLGVVLGISIVAGSGQSVIGNSYAVQIYRVEDYTVKILDFEPTGAHTICVCVFGEEPMLRDCPQLPDTKVL